MFADEKIASVCPIDTSSRTKARISGLITLLLAAVLILGGCGDGERDRPLEISMIGVAPRLVDPNRGPLSRADAVLNNASAMGLVALDASGQIEPALAETWIVTDQGLSYIFRIRRMRWPDGREVSSSDVAASLNRAMTPASRNTLKPLLSAVGKVVGMTGRVVEIRLRVPRPNLLQLLAQPELGIRRGGVGLGPWTAVTHEGGVMTLTAREGDEAALDPSDATIYLRGERAALGVARFAAGKSNALLGGTVADWPLARVSGAGANRLRLDPAEGLFGLAVVGRSEFLRQLNLREALAMAIDRDALVAAMAVPGWTSRDRLLPAQLDSALQPFVPDWVGRPFGQRRERARQQIAAWTDARGPLEPLRVALPEGSGMRVVFARLAEDWRRVGVEVRAVPLSARNADLRLIDEVAPNSSANWYLTRGACAQGAACDENSVAALKASRAAPSFIERANWIAKADEIGAREAVFIPIATPLRWSLVDPGLTQFRPNSFAVHPLDQLRPRRNTREDRR